MRAHVVAMSMVVSLSGCQLDRESQDAESAGRLQQPLLGGESDLANTFPAVGALKVTLPPDEDNVPRDPYYCTVTLVEAQTVLTSAHCVWDDLNDDGVNDLGLSAIQIAFGQSDLGDQFDGGTAYVPTSVELHRYFDADQAGVNEAALLRLPEDPGITPVVIHEGTAIDSSLVGQNLTMVGYGDAVADAITVRRTLDVEISLVSSTRITAGTEEATSCHGDSGGPGFFDFGTGYELVSLNVRHGACSPSVARQRIDNLTGFIIPYIDRVGGPCAQDDACVTDGCRTPDPDCDDSGCAWDDTCVEDCPTRDWDCDLGSTVGQVCDKSGDCELGRCKAAVDDANNFYCTIDCDPAGNGSECPSIRNGTMECADAGGGMGECTFLAPTPGSQGATCALPGECLSGYCENNLCADECDASQANACPAPFVCAPAEDGTTVCMAESQSGGGGFCTVGRSGTSGPLAAMLALVAVLFFVGRRRR